MLAVVKDLDAVNFSIYYPGHGTVGCFEDRRSTAADGHIKAYLQKHKMIFTAEAERLFSDYCMQISVLGEIKHLTLKKNMMQ